MASTDNLEVILLTDADGKLYTLARGNNNQGLPQTPITPITVVSYPMWGEHQKVTYSDYEPIPNANVAATGDPYIVPLDGGAVWKMPNFEGYSRMLQGKLDGKELTINVKTTISSAEEAAENKNYSREMLNSIGLDLDNLEKQGLIFDDMGEAFMRELWVKYGDKETFINMEKLTLSNNKDFQSVPTSQYAAFEKYDCHDAESISINIGNSLALVISKYPNPQVRTGFCINGKTSKIKNASGVLCHKLYKKDMQLKKLTSTKPLTQTKNRPPRSVKYEQYWNSEGKEETMKLDVY